MKKTIAIVLALALLVGGVVGGVLAWLQDTTDEVVNTFTVGEVDIDLNETNKPDFVDVIPGNTYAKDPTVTVTAESEDCYVFVTVTDANAADVLDYAIADGWTLLEDGVYYRTVAKADANKTFPVLKDNQVTINGKVVNGQAIEDLSFKAYAVQSANVALGETAEAKAAAAWAVAKTANAEFDLGSTTTPYPVAG